jgi:nitrogen fixation protein FixH
MKINWGTGLVIGMVLFIVFIMFMVMTMMTDERYDHDLVTEEYYEKDLQYQREIDAEKKGNTFSAPIRTERSQQGISLYFPPEIDTDKLKGKVSLYRPSNQSLDFDLPLVVSNGSMLIPNARLLDGRWDIRVEWEYEGEEYLYKEAITY